jgi:hypothetical protein
MNPCRIIFLVLLSGPVFAECGGQSVNQSATSGSAAGGGSSDASASGVSAGSGSGSGESISSGSSSAGQTSGATSGNSQMSGSTSGNASGSGTTQSSGMQDGGSPDGGDAGGRAPDTCTSTADCPGGACWLHLDGHRACVQAASVSQLEACFNDATPCCLHDADCAQTGKTTPRCLPHRDVAQDFCGGAQPVGNVCSYDQCSVDFDCNSGKPAGAMVATCLPAGALVDRFNSDRASLYNAVCGYGVCRTDADCTLHPGGQCQFGLVNPNGMCSLSDVLYCAYPSDPCQTSDNFMGNACYCVPTANDQGQQCGKAPPMYP